MCNLAPSEYRSSSQRLHTSSPTKIHEPSPSTRISQPTKTSATQMHSMDEVRGILNDTLRSQSRNRRAYSKASVLSLYWEDDDMGCIDEAKKITTLFEEDFGYHAKLFGIPSQESQSALTDEVLKFKREHGKPGSLLVIYYGGHGDPDDKECPVQREAVWAARRSGGSTLRWHHIQPLLKDTQADVLLIFDCCYAAQAVRGRTAHKFQFLGASAMGVQTPVVGEKSFTSLLVNQIRVLLRDNGGWFTISQLHRHLSKKKAGLVQTPVFCDLSNSGESLPMILKPLRSGNSSSQNGEDVKSVASLTLKFTLPQNIDRECAAIIADWLDTAPTVISGMSCTEVTTNVESSRIFDSGSGTASCPSPPSPSGLSSTQTTSKISPIIASPLQTQDSLLLSPSSSSSSRSRECLRGAAALQQATPPLSPKAVIASLCKSTGSHPPARCIKSSVSGETSKPSSPLIQLRSTPTLSPLPSLSPPLHTGSHLMPLVASPSFKRTRSNRSIKSNRSVELSSKEAETSTRPPSSAKRTRLSSSSPPLPSPSPSPVPCLPASISFHSLRPAITSTLTPTTTTTSPSLRTENHSKQPPLHRQTKATLALASTKKNCETLTYRASNVIPSIQAGKAPHALNTRKNPKSSVATSSHLLKQRKPPSWTSSSNDNPRLSTAAQLATSYPSRHNSGNHARSPPPTQNNPKAASQLQIIRDPPLDLEGEPDPHQSPPNFSAG